MENFIKNFTQMILNNKNLQIYNRLLILQTTKIDKNY